ncbi:MAG: tRNA (adenosine(37)-N6)-dimethylallyltransferase MiaA [Ruminococcaceae bacterium]|nr:tRNA (adenosine(37)-N6)-dimethylallyltransferase MiaA [Oscillospiraceae bacterium]
MEKIPVYAVVGPTASGKSAYAIRLAKELDGEVISGDSMQIYRGMDIGTAKASVAEQQGVPHHLLDVAEITEGFSAGRFMELAKEKIAEIHGRGKTPILCGGTGLYIELLLTGKQLSENTADEKLREELLRFANEQGNEALHARLAELDPKSAENIHPNNVKRVVRALEIALITGSTKSEADEKSREGENPYAPTIIRLTYADRGALYEKIDLRVRRMFEEGLENEVRTLCDRGLRETPTASQAIGYKEFYPYFDGEISLAQVEEDICRNTRRYAKRQETWFSRMHYDQLITL